MFDSTDFLELAPVVCHHWRKGAGALFCWTPSERPTGRMVGTLGSIITNSFVSRRRFGHLLDGTIKISAFQLFSKRFSEPLYGSARSGGGFGKAVKGSVPGLHGRPLFFLSNSRFAGIPSGFSAKKGGGVISAYPPPVLPDGILG